MNNLLQAQNAAEQKMSSVLKEIEKILRRCMPSGVIKIKVMDCKNKHLVTDRWSEETEEWMENFCGS